MLGSEILDVALGLAFVYVLVSIICSAVREGIEAWMKTRAVYLERGIRELLMDREGTGLVSSVMNHPLLRGLFSRDDYKPTGDLEKRRRPLWTRAGIGKPSYIPSNHFAMALLDIAARGPSPAVTNSDHNARVLSLDNVRRNILHIGDARIQRVLLSAVDAAQGDLDKAVAAVEAWFDGAMDRVSGWYKRTTHWFLFFIGLFVAISMNIDTITIVERLYEDEGTRAAVAAMAGKATPDLDSQAAANELKKTRLPIGWNIADLKTGFPDDGKWYEQFWAPLLGWLLTAFAATLGAPFWFDVLNKVMVIRSTVKPREKSQEEGSEDRQLKSAVTTMAARVTTTPGTIGGGGPAPPLIGNAADAENDVDGCEVDLTAAPISDEQLPAAEGGVA